MTSPSRIDPPGSTTAGIRASASTCRPSANGKYASLAATAPLARSPLRTTAILAESTRLTWPMPTPTVAPPLASTIALDFAARQARQAKARSARTSLLASGPALSCQAAGSSPGAPKRSAVCISMPPSARRAPPRGAAAARPGACVGGGGRGGGGGPARRLFVLLGGESPNPPPPPRGGEGPLENPVRAGGAQGGGKTPVPRAPPAV